MRNRLKGKVGGVNPTRCGCNQEALPNCKKLSMKCKLNQNLIVVLYQDLAFVVRKHTSKAAYISLSS